MRLLYLGLWLAASAHADPRRIKLDSAVVRHDAPRPSVRLVPLADEALRSDRLLYLMARAQQLTEPHGHVPTFLPLLGTTQIGGSLQLDF